jgi:hypothetical protein
MGEGDGKGVGLVELVAIAVVAVFGVILVVWVFGFIASALWWVVKIAALMLVLLLVVRWALRRATR